MNTTIVSLEQPSKRRKRLLIALLGLTILALLVVLRSLGPAAQYITQRAIEEAARNGIRLSVGASRLGFLSFEVQRVSLFFPRAFTSLEADSARASLPLAAFTGKSRLDLSGELYGGTFEAATRGAFPPQRLGSGRISGVQLARHPQLRGLGITAGVLELSAQEQHDGTVTGSLLLSGVEKPSSGQLPGWATGGLPILVPAFSALELRAEASITPELLMLKSVSGSSSLMSLSGGGSVLIKPKAGTDSDLKVKVTLTDAGVEAFKGWITLLSGDRIRPGAKQFEVTFRGTLKRLSAHWR